MQRLDHRAFLENSNVNSMQEMVQLIQSMRHFESMQRVALGYDEMIGAAIRKLGDGGFQYQLLDRVPLSSFRNTRP